MRTIDADALKRKVQRLATESWKMKIKASVETILNQFIDDIDHAPTVDAAPVKHGRWINGKCDKCGGHAPFWTMATTYYPSKFCPHCGARMDGKGR